MRPVELDRPIEAQDWQDPTEEQGVIQAPSLRLHRLQTSDHSLQPFYQRTCHPDPSLPNTSSMTFAARWRDSAAMPPYRSTVVATFACPSVAMTMRRSPPEPSSMSAAAVCRRLCRVTRRSPSRRRSAWNVLTSPAAAQGSPLA